jgi:hypothetical protein
VRGFTYTVIRLDLRQAEFPSGLPDMNVLMKGRKLYDPRTGLTSRSDNPALVIYNYHRGAIRRRCVGQSSMIDTRKKILTAGGSTVNATQARKQSKSSTNDTADRGCFAYNLSPYCRVVPSQSSTK